jgi:hypothetical protein
MFDGNTFGNIESRHNEMNPIKIFILPPVSGTASCIVTLQLRVISVGRSHVCSRFTNVST